MFVAELARVQTRLDRGLNSGEFSYNLRELSAKLTKTS